MTTKDHKLECRTRLSISTILVLAFALTAAGAAAAQVPENYSPYAGATSANNVYWGDTHVHSSWSPDAWTFNNHRLGPDAAFRFAAGEVVTAQSGVEMQLRRPLDFLLVSDHSEYLGLFPRLTAGDPVLLATETGKRWHGLFANGEGPRVFGEFINALVNNHDALQSEEYERSVWDEVIANADRANRPGRFTAFIGYEWSSMPNAANLHRVVVYKDGADVAGKMLPFSSLDGNRPEQLWRFMAEYESHTGGEIFAIPHNSNLSAGLMFALEDSEGNPLTKEYADTRRRWEPLVEATQIKGDSETHPILSPDDEFADYGSWDETGGFCTQPHEDWMFKHEYVRGALGLGLDVASRTGANPFQFGLIGSTDSHTSFATADENDFWGKFTADEPSARRAHEAFGAQGGESSLDLALESGPIADMADSPSFDRYKWSYVASGYAAVWARENTREALFEAMQRRETYATTGPRITVRLFGGFDFVADDALAPDIARVGYAKGVPMGSELAAAKRQRAPGFLVSALRDPDGANLDRVQIIKGWRDDTGELHERVFDVAVSGDRKIDATGRCLEKVGNSVDLTKATWKNAIGASELTAVWRDPDFDPKAHAFYYARILEIPTPHWTVYDAAFFDTKTPDAAPKVTQERAYTSPIWYTPAMHR